MRPHTLARNKVQLRCPQDQTAHRRRPCSSYFFRMCVRCRLSANKSGAFRDLGRATLRPPLNLRIVWVSLENSRTLGDTMIECSALIKRTISVMMKDQTTTDTMTLTTQMKMWMRTLKARMTSRTLPRIDSLKIETCPKTWNSYVVNWKNSSKKVNDYLKSQLRNAMLRQAVLCLWVIGLR